MLWDNCARTLPVWLSMYCQRTTLDHRHPVSHKRARIGCQCHSPGSRRFRSTGRAELALDVLVSRIANRAIDCNSAISSKVARRLRAVRQTQLLVAWCDQLHQAYPTRAINSTMTDGRVGDERSENLSRWKKPDTPKVRIFSEVVLVER